MVARNVNTNVFTVAAQQPILGLLHRERDLKAASASAEASRADESDARSQIAEQVRESAEVARIVDRLEQRYDEHAENQSRRSLLVKENDELPDADEIGSAVEAYLAAQQDRPRSAD